MHVFVTGASGHVGSAVVPELLAAGHTVTGLARSDASAQVVEKLGARAWRGDLDDLDGLAEAAREADGVIHLAFKHDEMQVGALDVAVDADLRAVEAMGAALKGTGKPFVGTNGMLGMFLTGFRGTLTENDTMTAGPRTDAENVVVGLAEHGVRSSVVRLAPVVHAHGKYGFVSVLTGIAERAGVAGYPGDGSNRWTAVENRDTARLYRLALESSPAGSRWHSVAEEAITLREIAEAIGSRLGIPAAPAEPGDFGFLSDFVGVDAPASARITRERLGWEPAGPGLLEDYLREL